MNDAIMTRDCVIADLTAECKELRAELSADRAKVAELTAQLAAKESAEQEPVESPLGKNRWHHGNGVLVCGTIRIARADFDTSPSQKFQDDMFAWICNRLNTPPTTSAAVAAFKRSVLTVVQPDDSYQDEWFKAKADCYARVEALPADESALCEIVEAAVAAFRRKAAEVCDHIQIQYGNDGINRAETKAEILAIPADESALREICKKVAKKANHMKSVPDSELEAIVNEALGK